MQIALLFILQIAADDVEKSFDTSNYEVDIHCLQVKIKSWLD